MIFFAHGRTFFIFLNQLMYRMAVYWIIVIMIHQGDCCCSALPVRRISVAIRSREYIVANAVNRSYMFCM